MFVHLLLDTAGGVALFGYLVLGFFIFWLGCGACLSPVELVKCLEYDVNGVYSIYLLSKLH